MLDAFGIPSSPFPSPGYLLGARSAPVLINDGTERVYLECPWPGGILTPGRSNYRAYSNFLKLPFAGPGITESPYLIEILISGVWLGDTVGAATFTVYRGKDNLVVMNSSTNTTANQSIDGRVIITAGTAWNVVNVEAYANNISTLAGDYSATSVTLTQGLDISQSLSITGVGTVGGASITFWSVRVYAVPLFEGSLVAQGLSVDTSSPH
jgi:hypothetical protein